MKHRTLKDLKDVKGKRILVRVDFNVPVDEKGNVTEDSRIRKALPTIKHLLDKGAKLILMSHYGRPEGQVLDDFRLNPAVSTLEKLLGKKIRKLDECTGGFVQKVVKEMKDGDVVLLENTRFHPGEEGNHPDFAKELASLGEIYVNDGFGVIHKAHASVSGITQHLPSYMGLLVENELKYLTHLMEEPKRPYTIVMGGAKIKDKIGLIKNLMKKADYILIGGGIANTFLAAQGFDVGQSLCEKDKIQVAQEILIAAEKLKVEIILPSDVVVATLPSDNAVTMDIPVEDVEGDMKIFDIGSKTTEKYKKILEKSKTIFWNGPMGLYEYKPFGKGTKEIAAAIAKNKGTTVIGGGDSVDALKRFKFDEKHFSHISTGGGASLSFLEGKELPGVKALIEK
ncbi:MAG: phosphoglycerate kinase, phosphoglycerate kinase [Candidatus Peregrinibacteria bacterium GW2011_GWF2_38_29]|nr:MAG: phosphoglycerate kinase, phosphoglycerate kinase [Candidatus Peregrinibacteria bacterium GW2011_GWF2_38_29]HBB03007.1 phosphoglycerate kinase [Candidatus Peregrinibacteria bacterium]